MKKKEDDGAININRRSGVMDAVIDKHPHFD
jgi:hypothetical protein